MKRPWCRGASVQANSYEIDEDDWHANVHHRLPYTKLLRRDDALRDMLQSISLPKFVFTNADKKHAQICLELLGIADLFQVSTWSQPSFQACLCLSRSKATLLSKRPCPVLAAWLCPGTGFATNPKKCFGRQTALPVLLCIVKETCVIQL